MTESIADLRQNCQQLLENAGYPAENINGMLRVAGRVSTVLGLITESLEAAKKNPLFQQFFLFVETIADTFIEVVVNPEKGYVFVTNRIASVSCTIAQLIGLETDIPVEMRRRVEEVKDYFKKVQSVMSEVDDDANKMTAMIDSACENNFTISPVEMKQLRRAKIKLDRKLQTCEDYLDGIHEVLNILESDVRAKVLELGLKTAFLASSGAGLLKGAASTAMTITEGVDIAEKVASLSFDTTLGIGLAATVWKLLTILCNYSKLLLTDCENIKIELRKIKLEFTERKRKAEELREEMGLLEMKD